MSADHATLLRSPAWPADEPWHLAMPEGTLYDALARAAQNRPSHPAAVFYGASLSYAELRDRVDAMAGFLQKVCGVARGDRVMIALQNSPQYVIAYYAVMRADAVIVPVNPMNKTGEIAYLAEDSGARVAITGSELSDVFAPLVGEAIAHAIVAQYRDEVPSATPYTLPSCVTEAPSEVPSSPGWHAWSSAIAQGLQPGAMAAGPDDLMILPYTSGTTGKPKACMHTHRSALFTAVLQARWYGMGADDVMTGFMPLFHVAGMQGSMNAAMVAGATLLLMARWDKDLLPDLFETYGVSFWNAAPTMIVDVLASARFRDRCFAKLKVLTGGGAAMPTAVAERLKGRFGLDFVEGYGMTETMSPTHINPMAAPKRQCLGIAVHETDARIIDPESLIELDDNVVGEIVVHGPQVLQGYWNRPQANAESFIELQGKRFLRTGDLGYRDAEGYFFAVDRLKRMINVSGFKVWPAEVEAAMYQNRAIRECCIISAPDSYRGETVKALVVLDEAARASTSPDDVVSWARGAMASYKAPRAVVFVDELPRTASNKINWRLLQDAEWGRTA
ncbi:long-chain-fatty-acid--CoA ligase [Bradyrhizobium cosmicum]|uniref:long-chain-fatty-acid--CoA ligase n=1 Tax=Bradyrhizobium cosmicum TaxID=1404864 RepID=UPI00116427C7|nr:long-chain-fatty-acid--CoA ligase [Bradyrhizobium cosmicum]QDP25246.1 AMP-binding protein [Bradyrhizobium cosmicum]